MDYLDIPSSKQLGASTPRDNRRLKVIASQEAQAILEALKAQDVPAWRLIRFAFLTGCRLSEGTNLRWGHIDQERKELIFTDTKNKSTRRLPLTQPLAELFTEIERRADDTCVFLNQRGGFYTKAPSAFVLVIADLGFNKGRGLRECLSFHSIRHTVASILNLNLTQLTLRELMDTMGWKTVAMAAR